MPTLRARTDIPLATGELFTSVADALPLLADRRIDFLRCHLSTIGGFTPASGWRRPATCSGADRLARPRGLLADRPRRECRAGDGIQGVRHPRTPRTVGRHARGFPGAPTASTGVVWPNTGPGWGVEVDEAAPLRYPAIRRIGCPDSRGIADPTVDPTALSRGSTGDVIMTLRSFPPPRFCRAEGERQFGRAADRIDRYAWPAKLSSVIASTE